ncbi:hypothetical protein [Anaerocolumna jejuensis]|uniref:hypothetical protein n=1 Tax=Anaerocolumna jejuensis TaxID=259063 RepID=UPI003F7BF3A2
MKDKTPTDSENKNLTERIVAFVDILGFKNMVKDSLKSLESANSLHEALKRIFELKNHNENPTEMTSLREFGVEISTFSDSIVISYPIDYEGGLFFVLMELIHLQLDLACYGILIRGGLSIGLLYHDGNIVYGPAMNEAYYLESKCAIYPRIIIKKEDIIEGIRKTRAEQNTMEQDINYVMSCLKVDNDEWFFLDILRQYQELVDWGDEYYNWLVNIRKIIISGLNQYSNSPRVYEKYNWLKKYYNEVVTDRNARYPVPDENYCDQIGFRRSYLNLKIKKRVHKGSNFV